MPTDNTDNTKFFFSQQITQITQKNNFVIFVSSVGKRKDNQVHLVHLVTKTKTSVKSVLSDVKKNNNKK